MINIIKVTLGIFALALGFIGIIIPILPTTPFILISLGCFSSLPKLKNRILSVPIVKEYYLSYTKKQGLKRRTVIWSLLFLWITLIISSMIVKKTAMFVIFLIIGLLVSAHILTVARPKK